MKKKESNMSNATANASVTATSFYIDSTIDECIEFCLGKAADSKDKATRKMYLSIVKHLMKSNCGFNYGYVNYPVIQHIEDNKKKDDWTQTYPWEINKVYCSVAKDEGSITCEK